MSSLVATQWSPYTAITRSCDIAQDSGTSRSFYKASFHNHCMATKSNLDIQPLGDRVVVLPADKEEKVSASGIIIPDTVDKEKPAKGKVVAVGPGRYDDGELVPMQVKVGQMVLFSKYGYDEVKVDGKEYYILAESQILAVIK